MVDLSLDKEGDAEEGGHRKKRVELVDQRSDASWLRLRIRNERAPGLRADRDGGVELPLSNDAVR